MPSKKPSFFERLTGTLQAEQKRQKQEPSAKIPNRDLSPPAKIPQGPRIIESQPLVSKTPESSEEKSENWLPQSEGQLAIDVYQTASDIVIKSTIAGVSQENLDVSITNDMVTIKGQRASDESVKADDYYYQECYWGPFSRSIILPTDILADQVSALLKNGILTIRLPKAEKVRTKKIRIETA